MTDAEAVVVRPCACCTEVKPCHRASVSDVHPMWAWLCDECEEYISEP